MEINFEYAPIPVHAAFHESTAYERFLFGAFGSGKTWAIAAEAIAWCLEIPGIRGMICRATVPALRDSTEKEVITLLPAELYALCEIKRTGGHIESIIFPNGSEMLFRSLDDWNKLRSMNLGFFVVDEADEIDEESYEGMLSRVRQREPTAMAQAAGAPEITRRGIWLASNPAGRNWLWRRSVNPVTRQDQTEYFTSTSFDNPYLPPEFIESLLRYPKQWVRRYVLCQFDDFAGQIYESWNWDEHVLKNKLNIHGTPVYWMGMDPGTRSPTAGLWVVIDSDGSLSGHPRSMIGIAEYQQSYEAAQEHAKEWRKIEAQKKMNVRWRVADPNSLPVKDRGTNMGLDEQYRRLGFRFALGPSKHDDRIPMLGQLISLKRFLLTPEGPQTYEAIKNYQWEDLSSAMKQKGADAPERPLKRDDHLVDCAQYLSSRWVKPFKAAPGHERLTPGQEVSRSIKKHLAQKRQGVIVPGIL